jgi:hypothetical protein
MRTIPGVGYVDDDQGGHLEPVTETTISDELDGRSARLLDAIYESNASAREALVERTLQRVELEAEGKAHLIAPLLINSANLKIDLFGLLFALDAAPLCGISMDQAGQQCAKLGGVPKTIDDLSHEHHKIASFLEASERQKWLEIARLENLSAEEFKTSLQTGKVERLHGVTRAAISKSKRKWQELLGIQQSRAGKSRDAIKAYRKRAFRVHHNLTEPKPA